MALTLGLLAIFSSFSDGGFSGYPFPFIIHHLLPAYSWSLDPYMFLIDFIFWILMAVFAIFSISAIKQKSIASDSLARKFKKSIIILLGSNIFSVFIIETVIIKNRGIFGIIFAILDIIFTILTWITLVLFSFIPHPRYLDRFIYLPITLLFCIACGIGLGMWIKNERKVKIAYGLIISILCFITISSIGNIILTGAGFE